MKHPDKAVYQAEMDGEQPVLEWVDDDTRAITLFIHEMRAFPQRQPAGKFLRDSC